MPKLILRCNYLKNAPPSHLANYMWSLWITSWLSMDIPVILRISNVNGVILYK